ncbi:glycosyltransferase family 39 protein [Gordonia sinesedis]
MLPVMIGVAAALVAGYGGWRPSLWYDEAATISATDRTVAQMWRLVEHVDSVHAAYYLMVRGWTAVFGFSEFSVRAPSALAVGAAAGLLVVVGRRLWDNRFGVIVAVVFVTLPRVGWAGVEARSYASTMLLAVAATLVLLIALDRGRWWWVGYTALVVASGLWFFLAVALIVGHVGVVVAVRYRSGCRWLPRGYLVATGVAVLLLCPYGVWVFGQRDQVSWIPATTFRTLGTFALFEYPNGSWAYLLAALVVLIGGTVVAATVRVDAHWRVAAVALAWWLAPAIVVVGFSWLGSAIYTPRYLAFTVPGLAIGIAWAVRQLTRGRRWATVLVVGVVVVVAIPDYLAQRGPYGRFGGTDFSQVADYVGAHARPGDCVAFGSSPSWSPVSQRVIARAKPADFAGLRDVGARVSADRAGALWDVDKPVTAYRSFAQTCAVMWVLTDRDRARAARLFPGGTLYWHFEPFRFADSALYRELAAAGLRIDRQIPFNNSQVVEMRR